MELLIVVVVMVTLTTMGASAVMLMLKKSSKSLDIAASVVRSAITTAQWKVTGSSCQARIAFDNEKSSITVYLSCHDVIEVQINEPYYLPEGVSFAVMDIDDDAVAFLPPVNGISRRRSNLFLRGNGRLDPERMGVVNSWVVPLVESGTADSDGDGIADLDGSILIRVSLVKSGVTIENWE